MTVEESDRSAQGKEHARSGARGTYGPFVLLAGTSCCLDLLTKHWVFHWRGQPGQQPIWWLWDGILGIETSLNRGALFGMGQGRVLWFALLSILALLGIAYWLVWGGASRDRLLFWTLACVTGGILGNLYDRLGLWSVSQHGWPQEFAVRDWVRISYRNFVWPNFNLADSLLVCGALMLVWHAFRTPCAGDETGTHSGPTPAAPQRPAAR